MCDFLCVWFQLLLHKLWAHANLYQRNASISQAGSLWFYHPIYKREPRRQRGLSQCFMCIRPKPLCCQGQAIFYNLLNGYIVMYWSFLSRKPLQISSYIRLYSSEQPGPNQKTVAGLNQISLWTERAKPFWLPESQVLPCPVREDGSLSAMVTWSCPDCTGCCLQKKKWFIKQQ